MNTDIRKVDLNLLVALKVLLEERSVSRAAERLSLTQPTVSGMLVRLRGLFNDPLFVRSQYGMLPTPRAETLLPALSKLLNDATELVNPEEFDSTKVELDLRISANDYMQSTILIPFAESLRKDAPMIRMAIRNLETTRLETMLAHGEIDLAITIPEFAGSRLRTEFLYREEYICVVKQDHPIRTPKVTIKQFLSYEHIMVSPTDGSFRGPVDDVLEAKQKKRRVAISVPSFQLLVQMLQAGDFIAFIPSRLLKTQVDSLRVIKPPIEVDGFDVIAAWHSRMQHDRTHSWLRDYLVKSCQ